MTRKPGQHLLDGVDALGACHEYNFVTVNAGWHLDEAIGFPFVDGVRPFQIHEVGMSLACVDPLGPLYQSASSAEVDTLSSASNAWISSTSEACSSSSKRLIVALYAPGSENPFVRCFSA